MRGENWPYRQAEGGGGGEDFSCAVSLRRLERDRESAWESAKIMSEPIRQVRIGLMDAGQGHLKVCRQGLHVVWSLCSLPSLGQGTETGSASLRVKWEALQYFKICSAEKGQAATRCEDAPGLVVFSFPHELRSLKNDYDVGSSDRRQRFIVLEIGSGRWPLELSSKLPDLQQSNDAIRKLCFRGKGKMQMPKITLDTPQVLYFFQNTDKWEEEACIARDDWDHGIRSSTRLAAKRSFSAFRDGIQNPFVYPLQGHPRAVKVYPGDISRLRGTEFLNDTLIDFYMEYIRHQMYPGFSERVHVFNSFFYKKLSQTGWSKRGSSDVASFAEKAHRRVARWTRDVNIFEKDFVIVPINTAAHWYVAIICHPGAAGSGSSHGRETGIIVLDSLGGTHNHVVRNLMDYLTWERHRKVGGGDASPKMNYRDAGVVRTAHPDVPHQTNFSDCGLFLLHYTELFFKASPASIRLPAPRAPLSEPLDYASITDEVEQWPYMFNKCWFRPAEASASKRRQILKLILEIGPRLEVQDSLLGEDALFAELETPVMLHSGVAIATAQAKRCTYDGTGILEGDTKKCDVGAENVPPTVEILSKSEALECISGGDPRKKPETPAERAHIPPGRGNDINLSSQQQNEPELEDRDVFPKAQQVPYLNWGPSPPERKLKRLKRNGDWRQVG